jgi:uncharacterized membrane protein
LYASGAALLVTLALQFTLIFTSETVDVDGATRISLYVGWCVLVLIMSALTFAVYGSASSSHLAEWLAATGPPRGRVARLTWSLSGGGAIWWAITGAAVTLYTLVGLALDPTAPSLLLMIVCAAVVVASAAMIIVSYAVHYARLDATGRGFEFPGSAPPRFLDYVYLAAQVSTTFGASDVALTTTRVRRSVTFHSIIATTFNTVIVALFVSVLLRGATPA